jgi:hypothetical protein
VGKGIAALTFDKDYQKKRRDALNKRPATMQEGIARSGKGLVMVKSIDVVNLIRRFLSAFFNSGSC